MAGERMDKLLLQYRARYQKASRNERSRILDEVCRMTGYHRKYLISLLKRQDDENKAPRRRRGVSYSAAALRVVERVWEAAGYPWSERLVALLPEWLPWAQQHMRGLTDEVSAEVLAISARQIDRRLKEKKLVRKRRIYGRTKPGTLLKHHIPIKTEHWDVHEPGSCEIDLVSHSGPSASGEFIYSLNVTDIHTGWCETRAIKGKCESNVVDALEDIRRALPFALKAIDSDNGSEFINYHLVRYCQRHAIAFTRGRPYNKDDNAHIEQKNWTHVRRVFGWDRFDTPEQLDAMNQLYRGPLRQMMNFYQPCVKLMRKERVGSRLCRHYEKPSTPLNRLISHHGQRAPAQVLAAVAQRNQTDPFHLSTQIEKQLKTLLHAQRHPKTRAA